MNQLLSSLTSVMDWVLVQLVVVHYVIVLQCCDELLIHQELAHDVEEVNHQEMLDH